MNKQTEYVIREDERCPHCGAHDLRYVGQDVDGYRGGMECAELHCNACGSAFAVDCDETAKAFEWVQSIDRNDLARASG